MTDSGMPNSRVLVASPALSSSSLVKKSGIEPQ
jgi:hypothetical protein